MMTPELSRWGARVVNTRYMQRHDEMRETFRDEVSKYDALNEVPAEVRALGTRALNAG